MREPNVRLKCEIFYSFSLLGITRAGSKGMISARNYLGTPNMVYLYNAIYPIMFNYQIFSAKIVIFLELELKTCH